MVRPAREEKDGGTLGRQPEMKPVKIGETQCPTMQ